MFSTFPVAKAPATASFVSRRSLFWLAWVLLAISLLIPAPAGSFVGGAFGVSGFYVFGKAAVWSDAVPGSPESPGFWRGAILALALFSNIVFVYMAYMRRVRDLSITWKGFLLVALAIDAGVAFLVPEFARLPAYWIWLLSMVALAIAFVVFPSDGEMPPGAKSRKRRSAVDNGEMPPFVWVLFGFTLFWLAVSAGNHVFPPRDSAVPASVPLTSYVTDRAHVLKGDEARRLTFALEKFEKITSNQIVIAIYPRAPAGSIDDFTIRTADRSRLGRKGLDNGAILFLFMDERTARLEVGYGLEGTLTHVQAHRILEAQLAPAFARGDYFDGLDATLRVIFGLGQDAYQRDRMPGKLTKLPRQMKVESPKIIEHAWSVVSKLGLGARIGITFLGALLGVALWDGVRQLIRLAGDLTRGALNVLARRPFSAGMESVDVGTIWDSLRVLVVVLGLVVPPAAVVIIAAGGAFGGAGALIHW